ncbi:MAG: hypothetical protein KGN77_01895 [Xanthomonadaceae bacterium]|nr:hypothetical protein [Xanthomonadaceae bacterium]
MSDGPAHGDNRQVMRLWLDGAIIAAIIGQIALALFWAGGINAQVAEVRARLAGVEATQANRTTALSDIAVRLGRIDQKLTDIGQKVGSP